MSLDSEELTFVDKRAHERLDVVEARLITFEQNLQLNTQLTQTIADNTTELVSLVKGAKTFRKFIVWAAPVVAASAALVTYFKDHWK